MRVTFFHYIHGSPGPLVHVDEFAKAFRALGNELEIQPMALDLQAMPGALPQKKSWKQKWSPYFHELNTLRKNFSYYQRECEALRRYKPDVVIARYKLYHCSFAFSARKLKIPVVILVDAPAAYEQSKYLHQFHRIPGLAEGIEKMVINKADKGIVVSEETKKYLPPGVRTQITEVANGVDIEKFNPSLDGSKARALFPFQKPLVLGFVGSFSPFHGLDGLKKMMKFALEKYENVCFLLVGDGPGRAEVEAVAKSGKWDKRRVHFAGYLNHDEVPQYVAGMDVCLLPYQSADGFYFSPLKLFEYLSCAKPVLAAQVGQIARVLDGQNGLFYEAGNDRDMNEKLKQLIESSELRGRIGTAARKTVMEKFTWDRTALSFEKILKSVIKKAPA